LHPSHPALWEIALPGGAIYVALHNGDPRLARKFLYVFATLIVLAIAATFAYRLFGVQMMRTAMVPSAEFRALPAANAGAYADQAGNVVATWQSQWERPEIWLFDFHHHLFAGDTGETVAGIAGIAGLFFVLSGIILWWRTRKTFEFRLWPRRMSRPAIVRQHRDLGIHSGVATDVDSLKFIFDKFLEFRTYQQDAETTYDPASPLFWENSAKYYVAKSTELPKGADYAAKNPLNAWYEKFVADKELLAWVDAPLDDKPAE